MVAGLYDFLAAVGFTHPLHPALVHIPMGMVVGAVLFAVTGEYLKKPQLATTAYHCIVLALIFVVPTIIAGILDWLHLFNGAWSALFIIKYILAVLLTGLLIAAVVLKNRGAEPRKMMIVYLLCLACAGGLGFTGGEILYG